MTAEEYINSHPGYSDQDLWDAATEIERERCAKIAEETDCTASANRICGKRIAYKIRVFGLPLQRKDKR